MKYKYTIEKSPFSFNFITMYMLIFMIILFVFSFYLKIDLKVNTKGVIKNYISYTKNYSEYDGVIENIFVKEGESIKEGDLIYSIKVFDENKNKREEEIKSLEFELSQMKKNSQDYIKNQKKLEFLNEINKNNIKNIYSSKDGIINSIYIKKNDFLEFKEETMEISNFSNNKNNLFIEAYFEPHQLKDISTNDIVDYNFVNFNDLKFYSGSIFSISKNILSKEEIAKKSNDMFNKPMYYSNINILNYPEYIKEGFMVEVQITYGSISFLEYIME